MTKKDSRDCKYPPVSKIALGGEPQFYVQRCSKRGAQENCWIDLEHDQSFTHRLEQFPRFYSHETICIARGKQSFPVQGGNGNEL